ncbi:hypothetical protein BLA29_008866 [Euroglyphus maynei]|uniref:Uncharacterized protein n=1 Tax=Euroglyphus maynei TaxID=6958 RepID=A0A1Y3B1X9_EURMA|nr:hypothetical protein BLA29_008866 [Euroglyphus maynei]
MAELDRLNAELELIRKEQESLISLLGDQNLKLQYYETEFKNRGLESVIKETAVNDNKPLDQSDQRISNEQPTLVETNLNYQQPIIPTPPVYENTNHMRNELPPSSTKIVDGKSESASNAIVTATTSSSSSSMNDNPIQKQLPPPSTCAPTISLLPMNENHYSYSHPSQYRYVHPQENQYPLINSTPVVTTTVVTASTQQQPQLYQHSNPEMHS